MLRCVLKKLKSPVPEVSMSEPWAATLIRTTARVRASVKTGLVTAKMSN